MKLVLSHPTGNENVRAVAAGLMEADLLAFFQTAVASFQGDVLDTLANFRPFRGIRRRSFDPVLKPLIKRSPWLEWGRVISTRAGVKKLIAHEKGPFCIDAVCRNIDRRVASQLKARPVNDLRGVYAYEDSAKQTFQIAKTLGLQCFYDLPIGYWRASRGLLATEKERWPEWAATITGFDDSEAKLNNKDDELVLADHIYVASTFTAKTLSWFPGNLARVEIIPYGFPDVFEGRQYPRLMTQPLKLLFVGSLSQRKGIADLFEALAPFGPRISLTVVGHKVIDHCKALESALSRHRWIPSLPHSGVLELMRQNDLLIFPSLFEGFGLVITEAMSQGTPVITTERTAGPDLIEHENNGWLFEAGKTEQLQTIIEKLLSNPRVVSAAGEAAKETARRRPWKVYSSELAQSVFSHLILHHKG